jgi:hypothetical protein
MSPSWLFLEQLNTAAEANMVAHMAWLQQRTAGMQVLADDQLILVDSGLPTDTFNIVCRARLAVEHASQRIDQVLAHFTVVGRPFSWWVGPSDRPHSLGQALVAAGLQAAESEVAMAADLNALPLIDLSPRGLRIEPVHTAEQVRQFATILAPNQTPPDLAVLEFYELASPLLLAPGCPISLYVGYVGPEAVATAEVTIGGGVVGLYNISTLEAHRRQGIGSAITVRPLLDARAEGYKTAILQASPAGQGVYTRLGFRATGLFTEYKPPK